MAFAYFKEITDEVEFEVHKLRTSIINLYFSFDFTLAKYDLIFRPRTQIQTASSSTYAPVRPQRSGNMQLSQGEDFLILLILKLGYLTRGEDLIFIQIFHSSVTPTEEQQNMI